MNPINNTNINTNNDTDSSQQSKHTVSSTSVTQTVVPTTSGISKEHEGLPTVSEEVVEEISPEVEIPKEVEAVGIAKIQETIELPPDVKKLGVTPSGASTPLTTTATLPTVTLPISDWNVLVGLHAQITSALRWLALWCIRKLKKAHIAIKVIHGKIVRVRAK